MPAPIPTPPPYNPFLAARLPEGARGCRHRRRPHGLDAAPSRAARTRAAAIVGCAPCYVKSHSQGEYVFDHAWADAYARAGGDYYPKLQIAVPFTPVPGRRLLVRPGPDARDARGRCWPPAPSRWPSATACRACTSPSSARANGSGSASSGFLQRTDQQFHWRNAGLRHLRRLSRLARLAQAQGRAQGARAGAGGGPRDRVGAPAATSPRRTGTRSSPSTWTRARASGAGPISTASSSRCSAQPMAERCLLIIAKRGKPADRRRAQHDRRRLPLRPLLGRDRAPPLPALRGLLLPGHRLRHRATSSPRVEAGAQGEHKLARGYLPTKTYSAHYIADPGLRRAIADYLERERAYVEARKRGARRVRALPQGAHQALSKRPGDVQDSSNSSARIAMCLWSAAEREAWRAERLS